MPAAAVRTDSYTDGDGEVGRNASVGVGDAVEVVVDKVHNEAVDGRVRDRLLVGEKVPHEYRDRYCILRSLPRGEPAEALSLVAAGR